MKYIGNKTRLLNFIETSFINSGLPKSGTFIDIFGGTGSVGAFFKKKGYRVISNDIMTYSYVLQYVSIAIDEMPPFAKITDDGILGVMNILNDPCLREKGFFYENFAPGGSCGRQYFSDSNAQRIDAIREKIEAWKNDNKLSLDEYFILLAALIDAADFVANISGTYGAFLKIWRSMALKNIHLEIPQLFNNGLQNLVYQEDANSLIQKIKGDILYLDPPYNARQYAPNFHVLETLSIWDKPVLAGKTGQRDYSNKKSLYCQKQHAVHALQNLVAHADVRYILLSYNNEGIIPKETIWEILNSKGSVQEYVQQYRRFRTERDHEKRHYKECNDKVDEHLYVVKCF